MPAPIPPKIRDPRLDFFRGASLFIILVSHTRGDWLADWIPARFGLSDAANMFVFVSGYAGGMAFGGVFKRRGWLMGTARILLRVWQLYIAQLSIVLAVAALAVAADTVEGGGEHVSLLSLDYLFAAPREAMLGIVSLTYVPHYLDILPVYMVVLAMVPAAVALGRIHPLAVPAASVALWAAANLGGWNLPSDPAEPRGWFFDPFCWQLMFFSGFSLSFGWLKPPPADRRLYWAALACLAFGVAVTVPAIFETVPGLAALEAWIVEASDKTMLDPMQYLHFLASAYVAVYLLIGRRHLIQSGPLLPIVKCGQQALSVFLAGILLADLGGMAFDRLGQGFGAEIAVNAVIIGASFAVAYTVAWFKAAPWAAPAPLAAGPVAAEVRPLGRSARADAGAVAE